MRVLIVAPDASTAETVCRVLRYAPNLRAVGWTTVHCRCGGHVADARPELVLLDDGAGADLAMTRAAEIRRVLPHVKVVLLAAAPDAALLGRAASAGVDAVVSKASSPASAGVLLREIAAGNVFHFAPSREREEKLPELAHDLTARELEILRLAAGGLSNGHIARRLWVTEQTVKFHLSNVYRKLGTANRTEAAHLAHLHGLVDGDPLARRGDSSLQAVA